MKTNSYATKAGRGRAKITEKEMSHKQEKQKNENERSQKQWKGGDFECLVDKQKKGNVTQTKETIPQNKKKDHTCLRDRRLEILDKRIQKLIERGNAIMNDIDVPFLTALGVGV